jgi:hypothetical protein
MPGYFLLLKFQRVREERRNLMIKPVSVLLSVTFFFGWTALSEAQQYRTKEGIKQHAEERRRQETQRAESRKDQSLDRGTVGVDRRRQSEQLNRVDKERDRKIEVINKAEKEALKRNEEREKQNKQNKQKTTTNPSGNKKR